MFGNSELHGKVPIWLSGLSFEEQTGATCSFNTQLGNGLSLVFRLLGICLACYVNNQCGSWGSVYEAGIYILGKRRLNAHRGIPVLKVDWTIFHTGMLT